MSATTKTQKAPKTKNALEALKSVLPEGVSLTAALKATLTDKDSMTSLKEIGALAGDKNAVSTSDGLSAAQKKEEAIKYAVSLGLGEHPMLKHIKQVTRVSKGSSDVVYVLVDVGGRAGSGSVKRTVPHKENGGKDSELLGQICDKIKASIFRQALVKAEADIAINDELALMK